MPESCILHLWGWQVRLRVTKVANYLRSSCLEGLCAAAQGRGSVTITSQNVVGRPTSPTCTRNLAQNEALVCT